MGRQCLFFWSMKERCYNLRHMTVTKLMTNIQNGYWRNKRVKKKKQKSGHGPGDRAHADQFSRIYLPTGGQDINSSWWLARYCPGHNRNHTKTMVYRMQLKVLWQTTFSAALWGAYLQEALLAAEGHAILHNGLSGLGDLVFTESRITWHGDTACV